MKATILAAVAALGLCLSTATPANAQYYWQQSYYYPNTAYAYTYGYPGYTTGYTPYSYSPYVTGYTPYVTGYMPYGSYYSWNYYTPYTNQYRFWRWR